MPFILADTTAGFHPPQAIRLFKSVLSLNWSILSMIQYRVNQTGSSDEMWMTDVEVTISVEKNGDWQIDNLRFTITDGAGDPVQGVSFQPTFNNAGFQCTTDNNGVCDAGPARKWWNGPTDTFGESDTVEFIFRSNGNLYWGTQKTLVPANNTDATPEVHVIVNGDTISITKPKP